MLMLGGLFVCGALLAFAALTLVFRRPDPPRWTTRSGVGELVTIALVTLLTFGIGYLVAGAVGASQNGVDLVDLGLLIVVLAGSVLVWRRLNVGERLRLMERGPVGAVPPAASAARDQAASLATPGVGPKAYPAERAA